jgi:hypothetical protein
MKKLCGEIACTNVLAKRIKHIALNGILQALVFGKAKRRQYGERDLLLKSPLTQGPNWGL